MLSEQMKAEGWIEHDGKGCPINGVIHVLFRDGICLSYALPAKDWAARWDWWGCATKKDCDVVAYRPETSHD